MKHKYKQSLVIFFVFIVSSALHAESKVDFGNEAVLIEVFKFNDSEIENLTDYEKGLVEPNLTIFDAVSDKTVDENLKGLIFDNYQTPKYSFDHKISEEMTKFDFKITDVNDTLEIIYDTELFEKDPSLKTNYFFEIDINEEFNSPLTVRYPSIVPDYVVEGGNNKYQFNVLNQSNITLDPFFVGHHKMFEDGYFKLPFPKNVFLASVPKNRNDIDIKTLHQLSYLLSNRQNNFDNYTQIFNFVKLNLMWGGDNRARKPLEAFIAKTVGCGHMNNVVGQLVEFSGGRYRLVGGFDPNVRPIIPGGGHSAIEVYDKQSGKWSYLDSFLDIFTPNISAKELEHSSVSNLHVYTINVEGKDYVMTLGNLFRFRTYCDITGRRGCTPMTYLGSNEANYGTQWKTETYSETSLDSIKPSATLYIRGRYIKSNCATKYLGEKDTCKVDPASVVVSEWITKSIQLKR